MLEKICKVLSTIIMVVLLILAVLLIGPKLLGFQGYAVLSGSMEPDIPVGSIVYDKEVEPETLKTGDVITYQLSDNTLVTHRIISIDANTEEIITKGDANDVEDGAPVSYSNVVGKMSFSVPLIGYITIYGKTKLGIAAVCGVIVVLLLVNFLPDIFKEDEKDDSENTEKNKQDKQTEKEK